MQKRVLWLALLGAVMIASVCWTRWSMRAHDRATSRTLADGSVVRLREVAFGQKMRVRTGNRWQDHLGMVLPEAWAKKLGAGFVTLGDSNSVAVLLDWQGYFVPWYQYPTQPDLRATTFDQHGCEFELETPRHSFSVVDREEITFVFGQYPRPEKMVGLRIYQRGTDRAWQKAVEYQLTNPRPVSGRSWKAEGKPIKRLVDGEEFTLLELKAGIMSGQSPPSPVKPGERSGAAINFKLPADGDWELASFKGISDALGQKARQGGYSAVLLRNGEYQVCVDGGLCVEEAAWKVEAEFARKDHFPEKELWTLRGVPVPKKGEASLGVVETNISGAQLAFQGMASPESKYAKGIRSIRLDQPVAHIVCDRLPTGVQVKFVGGVDDAGRKIVERGAGKDPPNYLFGLTIPEGAKKVDLTFAVTKTVAVSYLVKPGKYTAEELRKIRKEW